MSLRSAFGILSLLALAASSSASILTCRTTGRFDLAEGLLADLRNTSYTLDFAYDPTIAPDYVNAAGDYAQYEGALLKMTLTTARGTTEGAYRFVATSTGGDAFIQFAAANQEGSSSVFGLTFRFDAPRTLALPEDLLRSTLDAQRDFQYVVEDDLNNVGYAQSLAPNTQAVPEPATLCVLGLGVAGMLRRRRTRSSC